MRLIDANALKEFINKVCFSKEWAKYRADYGSKGQIELILSYLNNAQPYQGEERVNIKMSEEEIKQFKQMLREHSLLYIITSNTFVEGASVERQTGHWIDDNGEGSYYANCSCCGYQIDTHHERGYLKFCPNCGADMRGGRE